MLEVQRLKAENTDRAVPWCSNADGKADSPLTMERDAILEVVDLSKHFGGLQAVKNVSFACRRQEILGVIGPNGAGKTTLFNLITGFVKASGGKVIFDDQGISALSATDIARLGVARTFQGIRLFKTMTVRENVWLAQNHRCHRSFFGNRQRSLEKELREEVDEILKEFHLWAKRDHVAGELPFGDMRRLEICRALATGPRLVLLDEPSSGLTPVETRQLIEDLRKLPERGLTVMIIEHDMNVALGLSDRVMVLNFGQQIAIGAPSQVRQNPDVILAYLGSVQEQIHAAR